MSAGLVAAPVDADAHEVLVIMPARNEAERIGPIIREVRERLPDALLLVIDDDSSDETPRVARAAGALVARLPFHLGYGGALQTGYRFAVLNGFRFLVQMDSDGQHRPEDLLPLLDCVRHDRCDLAVGSRFLPAGESSAGEPRYEMGWLRSLGRRTLCRFARLGGLDVTDPTSGLQAMNARVLALFAGSLYPIDYPDVDVLLLAHRRGLRIREIAVRMRPSPRPSRLHSGWMPIYYAYRMLLSLWALGAVSKQQGETGRPSRGRDDPGGGEG